MIVLILVLAVVVPMLLVRDPERERRFWWGLGEVGRSCRIAAEQMRELARATMRLRESMLRIGDYVVMNPPVRSGIPVLGRVIKWWRWRKARRERMYQVTEVVDTTTITVGKHDG